MNNPNMETTGKRAYQLQCIKEYQLAEKSSQKTASSISSAAGNVVTVADLFKFVKGLDKNFIPNVSSKVVNTDGTPKVMYHGTNSGEFQVFDPSRSTKRVRLNGLGDGHYFAASERAAKRYGDRVYPVYLDMKKPYRVYGGADTIRTQIAGHFGLDADAVHKEDIQKILRNQGYDGILLYSSIEDASADFNTAVVFDNTQIKSATDNIGTFDRQNPNIRFSIDPRANERLRAPAAEEEALRMKHTESSINSLDEYTEEQYNNFGWASYNGVLSPAERGALLSHYTGYVHGNHQYPITRFGEAVLFSSHYPRVFAYVKGVPDNPQITRVLRIVADDSEDVAAIRERIIKNEYEQKLLPYQDVTNIYGEQSIEIHRPRDCRSFWEYKNRGRKGVPGKADNRLRATGREDGSGDLGEGQGSRGDLSNVKRTNRGSFSGNYTQWFEQEKYKKSRRNYRDVLNGKFKGLCNRKA